MSAHEGPVYVAGHEGMVGSAVVRHLRRLGHRDIVTASRRELMHVDDLASACVFALQRLNAIDIGECINVGVGEDLTIRELAELVMRVVGCEGRIVFDAEKPDGTPCKLLNVSAIRQPGWAAQIPLESGMSSAYEDYLSRLAPDGAISRRTQLLRA